MRNIILGLCLLSVTPAAFAAEVSCKFELSELETVIEGRSSSMSKAHSAAVERCVEVRVQRFESKNLPVGEAAYSDIIDSCTTQTCDPS